MPGHRGSQNFITKFDVWLGDPLLEFVACFIILKSLKENILALRATGMTFGKVGVSTSDQFEELYPGSKLPEFLWLEVTGKAAQDDFGLSPQHRLVVSQRILDMLREAGMSHCDVTEFKGNG